MTPLFSVVVPAYNSEDTVAQTVRSVLRQTCADFELIVVDDGSTDGTCNVVRATAGDDPRLRLVSQENAGTAATRNAGIGMARGSYISFLDNDDMWCPGYLEGVRLAFEGSPGAGLAYADAWILDDASQRVHKLTTLGYEPIPYGDFSPSAFVDALLRMNFIIASTVTVSRKAIDAAGVFDTEVSGVDDYDLWLRIALGGFGATRAPGRLVVLRDRAGSQSKDSLMMHRKLQEVLGKVGGREDLEPAARSRLDAQLAWSQGVARALAGSGDLRSRLYRAKQVVGRPRQRLLRFTAMTPIPPPVRAVLAPDGGAGTPPFRVTYMVSRFPHVSETFVLRELNEVAAADGFEVELGALFPPSNPLVHPAARPWVDRVMRPGTASAAAGALYWAVKRPAALARIFGAVIAGNIRNPKVLVRALATVPVAAAHARHMETSRPDHIHAHFATYPAQAAWVCSRLTAIPYSFTAHAHDIFLQQGMLDRKVQEAKFVDVISEYNRRFLTPYTKDGRAPLELVHCGIDPAAYTFRERPLSPEGPLAFLCVGHFADYKGHRFLLDAMAIGGPRLERFSVDLIGSGPLQAELEEQIARLGLGDRVRMHGNVAEERVAEMLDSADGFVLPSTLTAAGRQDGIPVALMEAIASGLPVIASRVSGIPELVHDGESGVLAEPGDAPDLADQIARLIEGQPLQPIAARARVERDFNIHIEAAKLRALFRAPAQSETTASS